MSLSTKCYLVYRHNLDGEGNSQVDHTDLWCRSYSIPGFGCEAQDPRARIVDIYPCIACMYRWESDSIPAT